MGWRVRHATRGLGAFALWFGISVATSAAFAAPKEDEDQKKNVARGYVVEGDAALEKGDSQRALDRYERAERLIPAPTVRVRIARVLVKLGKLLEARAKYEEAAKTELGKDAPDVFYRALVEAQKELKELEPKIPTLAIVAPEGETGATIDDKPIPDSDLGKPFPVNPGPHQIKMPCCTDQESTVPEGMNVRVTLERKPKVTEPVVSSPPNIRRILGFSALGVGVVSLGVGLYGSVKARGVAAELQPFAERFTTDQDFCALAASSGEVRDVNGTALTDVEKGQMRDVCGEITPSQLLQGIFYPLGALGIAGGILLIVTSGSSAPKAPTTSVVVLPVFGGGQAGLVVRGAF